MSIILITVIMSDEDLSSEKLSVKSLISNFSSLNNSELSIKKPAIPVKPINLRSASFSTATQDQDHQQEDLSKSLAAFNPATANPFEGEEPKRIYQRSPPSSAKARPIPPKSRSKELDTPSNPFEPIHQNSALGLHLTSQSLEGLDRHTPFFTTEFPRSQTETPLSHSLPTNDSPFLVRQTHSGSSPALPKRPNPTAPSLPPRPKSPVKSPQFVKRVKPKIRYPNKTPPVCKVLRLNDIYHRGTIHAFSFDAQMTCIGVGDALKVWHLNEGVRNYKINFGEGRRVCSTLFIPNSNLFRIWVGLDNGDLCEVNACTGSVLHRRQIHNAPVTHIARSMYHAVSLDSNGSLKLWPLMEGDTFSILSEPRPFRVATKCLAIELAGEKLWLATENSIEVYHLSENAESYILKKWRVSAKITGLARLGSEAVITSHDTGSVSLWNADTFALQITIELSLYRITALIVVGSFIWAGLATGKILIFEALSAKSWLLIKEFIAFSDDAVQGLMYDHQSLKDPGDCYILSISDKGQIRLFDGLLFVDWICRTN